MEISKIEYRAVIKFFTLEGKSATAIHKRLVKCWGDRAPSTTTVERWVRLFKRGRTSLDDDPKVGRPKSATDGETIRKLLECVNTDRRLKLREIAKVIGISKDSVRTVLTRDLGMRKISARWVPKILSVFDKERRVQYAQENLDFMEGEEDFFSTLITGDETWCYYYDPETKVQSKQWKRKSSPAPVKGKREKSAGKVMATVFWDCEGIVHLEFMPKGSTITGASYAKTLRNLKEAVLQKRPKIRKKKIRLLHDNAPAHTSHLARAALHECKFEELFHPAYSPDLAPSDYYLFPNLKKHLKGTRFADNNAVEEAVLEYFEDLPKSFFKTGIESVKLKWEKCVNLLGGYIEKQ